MRNTMMKHGVNLFLQNRFFSTCSTLYFNVYVKESGIFGNGQKEGVSNSKF